MIEKEKDIEDFFKDDFERTKKEWETQVKQVMLSIALTS